MLTQTYPFDVSCTEKSDNSNVRTSADVSKVLSNVGSKKPKKPRAKKVETFLPLAIERGESWLSVQLPIKIANEGNSFEHWQKKYTRHKKQKELLQLYIKQLIIEVKLPCCITLTRYSPRELDKHDNLPYSFKWTCDALCDMLIPGLKPGRADNDKRISVNYDQVKSKETGSKIRFDWSN